MRSGMSDNKVLGIFLTITLILLAVLYAPVVPSMVGDWYNDPNYSHGFLVPLISAYFMWERRAALRAAEIVPSNFGLVVIAGSLLLLIFGFVGTEYFTMRSSLVFLLAGIVLYCFGWPVLRVLALPIGFLIFMVPLPYIVYDALAFPLKLLVTKFSVISLKAMGVIVWQEGNIIQFPETVLEVADACSGMRSMMSLLALSVAYAFFLEINAVKRFILVLLAVPIAILTNMLRVIGTGFLAQYYGSAAAEGFFHEFAGLAVFGLAMVFLVLAGTVLGKVGR
ncbi:MAG: exosortase [Deltaproteobacteria bacterium]|nr:exosortase [Candidatus Tharpella aukensis]